MHLIHVHILTVASSEAHYLSVTYGADGVKALGGEVLLEIDLNLVPELHIQIEGPEVLKVRVGFAANCYHVLPNEAACVVSPRARQG